MALSLFPAWFLITPSSFHSTSSGSSWTFWHYITHFNKAFIQKTPVLKTAITLMPDYRAAHHHFLSWPINMLRFPVLFFFSPKQRNWELCINGFDYGNLCTSTLILPIILYVFSQFACQLFPNVNFAIITNVFISILYMQKGKLKVSVLENDSYV